MDGKVYVWGDTKLLLADLSEIPDEVKNSKIAFAAAGTDHIPSSGDSNSQKKLPIKPTINSRII